MLSKRDHSQTQDASIFLIGVQNHEGGLVFVLRFGDTDDADIAVGSIN